MTKYWQTS